MKRIFVIFLALILVSVSVASAESVATPTDLCTHDNVRTESYYEYEYTPIAGNNEQHHTKPYCITKTYCLDCGEFISEIKEPLEEYDSHHDYESHDGHCSYCGYLPVCDHEGYYENYTNVHDETYIPVDNSYHIYHAYGDISRYCAYCNLLLSVTKDTEINDACSHNYDENEVCTVCGHKSTCLHTHLIPEYEEIETIGFEPCDEYRHTKKYIAQKVLYCFECDNRFPTEEIITLEQYESHYFDNNTCACGYSTACQHTRYYYGVGTNQTSYTDNNDGNTHTVHEKGYYIKYCVYCHKELEKIRVEYDRSAAHYYNDNGICECGYYNPNAVKSTCTHANKKWDQWKESWLFDCQAIDSKCHSYKYLSEYRLYCSDCGTVLSDDSEIKETEYITEHDFYHGYCDSCGYKNTCTHPNTKNTEQVWHYQNITSVTETGHTFDTCLILKKTVCSVCGESLDQYEILANDYFESHTYKNGKCSICGHEQPVTKQTIEPLDSFDNETEQAIHDLTDATEKSTLEELLPNDIYKALGKATTLLIAPFVTQIERPAVWTEATILTFMTDTELQAGKNVSVLLGWIHDSEITWIVREGTTLKDNRVRFNILTSKLKEIGNNPVIIAVFVQ